MEQALTETRHWTVREEEQGISHQRLIGKGGFGEVHEVYTNYHVNAKV